MSDKVETGEPKKTYTLLGLTSPEAGTFIQFPLNVTPKGLKTFTIDLDEVDIEVTGTKNKNGQRVNYMTFKIPTK